MLIWPILQATSFLAASVAVLYLSWKPLGVPGSHGFYRFFAWEAILGLVALNLPVWFRRPVSPPQLASWLLLAGSAYLVIHAVRLLSAVGHAGGSSRKSSRRGTGEANYAFENTAHLVRVGAYRHIRHPMYASLLYAAWGVYLKRPGSPVGVALVLAASIFLWLTARAEEDECRRAFGPDYERYMASTRRFIPFLL